MKKAQNNTACETCAYYDYNQESEQYECIMDLDEDEVIRMSYKSNSGCPYYKFYDEYKFVRKQN